MAQFDRLAAPDAVRYPLLNFWIDKVFSTAGLTVMAARRCMANICCGR